MSFIDLFTMSRDVADPFNGALNQKINGLEGELRTNGYSELEIRKATSEIYQNNGAVLTALSFIAANKRHGIVNFISYAVTTGYCLLFANVVIEGKFVLPLIMLSTIAFHIVLTKVLHLIQLVYYRSRLKKFTRNILFLWWIRAGGFANEIKLLEEYVAEHK